MTKADIQLVRALADKRGRTEHGLFVAEGEKLIGELRTSHLGVRKIFALEGLFSGPEVEVVGTKEMERLSLLKTASNSLALVEIPHYGLDMRALAGRLTLALDDVQNPGNLGTIVRLADWFGITDIVCSEASADCFNPKVVQATMGAILRVRVHYTDLGGFLRRAADAGLPVCGTFLEGENIYGASLPEAGIVVMGNEGRGLSDAAAATVTRKLFIPPYPADRRGSESLNVAMATGIVCAEFRRQAGTGGPGQARRGKNRQGEAANRRREGVPARFHHRISAVIRRIKSITPAYRSMTPEATGRRSPHSHRAGTPFTQPGNHAAHGFQGFGTPLGRQEARRIEPFDAPQEALHGIAHFVQLAPRGGRKVGSSQPYHRGAGAEFEIHDQGIAFAAVVERNPKGLEHQPENRGDQGRVVFPRNFFCARFHLSELLLRKKRGQRYRIHHRGIGRPVT